jgi:oligopeptide/dipeptide ABC transporter ATP-binding protein
MNILEVDNLSVDFRIDTKVFPAVSNVSFSLKKGEILALVGESGCGKSVTCMSLTRLLPEPPANYSAQSSILVKDKSVLSLKSRELRKVRRENVSYIFQEPSSSLNPVFRIDDQIAEAIHLRPDATEVDVKEEIIELLTQVGIPDPVKRMRCYPHELSGGMQQRVMIAMALAGKPDILIADEPTTALDVTIQAQILDLLKSIRDKNNMSIILVTHNLGIVADMADRVIVMYAGHTVESALAEEIIFNPQHPYTKALMNAVPKLGADKSRLETIPGTVPSPDNYPAGCRFYGRCSLIEKHKTNNDLINLCKSEVPEWKELKKGHFCRCHYLK